MASVARDLGEDLTAEPHMKFSLKILVKGYLVHMDCTSSTYANFPKNLDLEVPNKPKQLFHEITMI